MTATPIRVMSLADIKQLRRDLFRAVSGSLRMGDLHERAKLHGLTPWKHGFVWPVTSALYASYVLDVAAINGRNSQETRMGLDLSQAGRVDRAAPPPMHGAWVVMGKTTAMDLTPGGRGHES